MKKISFKLDSLSKLFTYGDRVHPTRDWLVLLGSAVVLFLLSVVWNVFLFSQIENGKPIGAVPTKPSTPDVGASVTDVQQIFQQRATEENHYQSDYHFVDPSLPGS